MPAKKRAAVDDAEDSPPPGSPAASNKRARKAPNGKENGQSKNRRAGKARADGDENMDEDDYDNEEVNLEEETNEEHAEKDRQFEEAHYDKIMASVRSREKYRGTVAESGVIEKVELFQFMCHQRLSFSFGPQINFIIGHNGSGKSAVLSAITIALGGKTISTGRGNGLKSFIREGQSAAEVTIQLKNKGEEGYRRKDFGDSIIISRRFTTEGSSTWKIKGKDGKVISTKREELSKICDHMNLQVDNPMTVLTQDASRIFLASSNPSERYNFFLKGTQLQQLSDEYSVTLENIRSTRKVLDQKKEAIPDLRTAFFEARDRFNEADKARKQKARQDDLKKEKAWALVKSKQDEFEKKLNEVAILKDKEPKIQEALDTAKAKFDEITNEFTRREEELNSIGNVNEMEKRKQDLAAQMKAGKAKLASVLREMNTMNTSIQSLKNSVAEYDGKIAEETKRLAKNTQAKRDQIQDQLASMQARVAEHESNLASVARQKQDLADKKANADKELKELEAKRDELQRQITFQEGLIRNCEKAEKDSLLPYGRNIQGVLDQIERMKWHGGKPLGPLGAHVKARDPQTWGELLRHQLLQQLCSFAVTDARDRNQLKDLLMKSGNNHVQITISSTELFDFSEGEPPLEYLTVLRALDISHPLVTRILVNTANIETRVLANTRLEAQRSLEKLSRGGQAFTLDGFMVRVFPDGVSSQPLDIRRNNDSSNLMLTGRDTGGEIQRARQAIASCRQQILDAKSAWGRWKTESQSCANQIATLSDNEAKEKIQLRNAQAQCQKLSRELNEEMPTNVGAFYDAKKEAEDEIESIKLQFQPLVQERNTVDAQNQAYLAEIDKLKAKINDFSEIRNRLKREIETVTEDRLRAQGAIQHYEKKLKETNETIDQENQTAENWTNSAAEYCERVENPRSVAEIEKLLESVGRALKEQQKKQGASLEELEDRLVKAKEQYDVAKIGIRTMQDLNKRLERSLIKRYARWNEFRRHIALRTKVVFQYHLSQRGYFGKLLFNHGSSSLELKVQTDDQASQVGDKEKDPRSLSGGEKSFSTICLLLALWESIGCPIRCLDEFDVFMDAVNRRISMKMMIDTANSSNQKQHILITPLEMSNISFGPTVRVHKMNDPQRNQGTLGFQ
ncbi:hypothetical protein D9756_004996 [Leucocoprinus leucothites]|uniref:RecF/RecN/SMC N-terminal domain-containing protein n=1 Tax=Leucocoprinus leucothites TaxID=201217 RepID=A0A8H5G9N3_9AGAR|nr:hypothetical protein D9756_004996 [Leucoagaricus leucothites]